MQNRSDIIATILGAVGVLFFMAMAFQIMQWNYAIFAGMACFILAGAVRHLSKERKQRD